MFGKLFSRKTPAETAPAPAPDARIDILRSRTAARAYTMARVDRLTADWNPIDTPTRDELRAELGRIRRRSRELGQNDDYARKFLSLVENNVAGPDGFRLQAKALTKRGAPDPELRALVESAYRQHSKLGFDVTGQHSRASFERLVCRLLAQDGEVFIRIVAGYENRSRFAVELIDPDRISLQHNDDANRIRLGIQYDAWKKPVAYYVLADNGGTQIAHGLKAERIPAADMIHLFVQERVGQERGVPWIASPGVRVRMLRGYEDAELVAARTAAAKQGFFVDKNGEFDTTQAVEISGEPGAFDVLPAGLEMQAWDPQHPTSAFSDFSRAILRSVAAGLGVSYTALSGDLTAVNYSSIRAGLLEERDAWRAIQRLVIERLAEPLFSRWLDAAFLAGALKIPFEHLDRAGDIVFRPRGWAWVDPMKDGQAAKLAIDEKLKSRSQICAEQGRDFEDVLAELADEKSLMAAYGLTDTEVPQL